MRLEEVTLVRLETGDIKAHVVLAVSVPVERFDSRGRRTVTVRVHPRQGDNSSPILSSRRTGLLSYASAPLHENGSRPTVAVRPFFS